MTNHIFRCTRTGMNIQVSLPDAGPADRSGDSYEAVSCPACARLHLVNKTTGKILSEQQK
jgi:hypothetical protein